MLAFSLLMPWETPPSLLSAGQPSSEKIVISQNHEEIVSQSHPSHPQPDKVHLLLGPHLSQTYTHLSRVTPDFKIWLARTLLTTPSSPQDPLRVITFFNRMHAQDLGQSIALVETSPDLVNNFISLKNQQGNPLLENITQLQRFLGFRIVDPTTSHPIERIESYLSSLQKLVEKTPYSMEELIYLRKFGVNVKTLTNFSQFGHYRETAFAYHLGRKGGQIDWDKESSKPKALILAGEYDFNEAFAPTLPYVAFIQDLQKEYNVRYRIVSTPEQFCQEIEKAAKEGSIELLIVGGHGSKETIRLGQDSRLAIDKPLPNDKCLELLAPHATIYLEACATGEGKEGSVNMANYFANRAPGRKIVAPQIPISIDNENLVFSPFFDVKIQDNQGNDIAYRIDPDQPQVHCAEGVGVLDFCGKS